MKGSLLQSPILKVVQNRIKTFTIRGNTFAALEVEIQGNMCHITPHVCPEMVIHHSSWVFLRIHALKGNRKYDKRFKVEVGQELPCGCNCLHFQALLAE